MKYFKDFQELSISEIFFTEEIFQKILDFFLTSAFAYAKILNKISNEGESQTENTKFKSNLLCC